MGSLSRSRVARSRSCPGIVAGEASSVWLATVIVRSPFIAAGFAAATGVAAGLIAPAGGAGGGAAGLIAPVVDAVGLGGGTTTGALIGSGDAVAETTAGGGAPCGTVIGACAMIVGANGSVVPVPVRGIPISVEARPARVRPAEAAAPCAAARRRGRLIGRLGGMTRGGACGGRGGNGGAALGSGGEPPGSVPVRRGGGVGVGPSGPGGDVSRVGQSPSPASVFSFLSGPFPSFRSGTCRILHWKARLNIPMAAGRHLRRERGVPRRTDAAAEVRAGRAGRRERDGGLAEVKR